MINIKDELKRFLCVDKLPDDSLQQEFKQWNPQSPQALNDFYIYSKQYIISNSIHTHLKIFKNINVKDKRILDFGCGCGSDSIPLAEKGAIVNCIDINILQQRFIRHVSKLYNLNINVIDEPYGKYDIIIMRDIIEHLNDYRNIVSSLVRSLNKDGLFVCVPSFLSEHRDEHKYNLHYKDKYDFPRFMEKLGMVFISESLWRKEDEYNGIKG